MILTTDIINYIHGKVSKESVVATKLPLISTYKQPLLKKKCNDYLSEYFGKDLEKINFAIKANICYEKGNIHCGSELLKDVFFPGYNATAVDLLLKQGFNLSAICHMGEFGMDCFGMSNVHGITLNLNPECIVGGSSSGSCKIVALDEVDFSLGTSTGGSVKTPAALTNLFGFEPSYGAVSRYGLVTFASSLDKIGVISKDLSLLFKVASIILKKDIKDMTSVELKKNINISRKIAVVSKEFLQKYKVDVEIIDEYNLLIENLAAKGFIIEEICGENWNFLDFENTTKTYSALSSAEAFFSLKRFNLLRFLDYETKNKSFKILYNQALNKLNFETRRRIIYGSDILFDSAKYITFLNARKDMISKFKEFGIIYPFILLPTLPVSRVFHSEIFDSSGKLNYELSNFIDKFCSWVNLVLGCSITFKYNNCNYQFISQQGFDFELLELIQNFLEH